MKPAKRTHPLNNPINPMLRNAVLIGGVLLVLLAAFVVIQSNPSTTKQPMPYYSTTPQPASRLSYNPTPSSQTFTSPDLGISFDYANNYTPKETGDMVYFSTGSTPEDSIYVKVMTKDPNDSITEAIKKIVIPDASSNECQVETISDKQAIYASAPAGYEYAVISIQNTANMSRDEIIQAFQNCYNAKYKGNQVYFLMDKNHPNKLLFVNIGQSNILSGKSDSSSKPLSWDATIRILDNQ